MNVNVDDFKPGLTPRKIIASLKRAKNRGATVNELTSRTGSPFSTTRRRVSEMLDAGILTHGATRKCSVTGNTVHTYKINNGYGTGFFTL